MAVHPFVSCFAETNNLKKSYLMKGREVIHTVRVIALRFTLLRLRLTTEVEYVLKLFYPSPQSFYISHHPKGSTYLLILSFIITCKLYNTRILQ